MTTGLDHDAKIDALDAALQALPGAVVAFSGGVDSSMLLHACARVLGARVLAVTARSPSLPAAELDEAIAFARALGVRHEILDTDELERRGYRDNGSDRCYFCKSELFEVTARRLRELADGRWPVLYGEIADDVADGHRPGARAAAERGVLAPLADAGLTKDDVRRYSRSHGLPTADKQSFACLASRVPHGTPIDAGLLARLERAEDVLRRLGYREFRVRHHGAIARVEVAVDELGRAATTDRRAIVDGIRAAGYVHVALDLRGFRSGSMHEGEPARAD